MNVEISSEWDNFKHQLVYRKLEFSFATVPKVYGGFSSVLINDLELEVDDEGRVICVSGLFPCAEKCEPTFFDPPESKRKRLQFNSDNSWKPGVSVRLNKKPWDCFFNKSTGWLAVGNPNTRPDSQATEFTPNCIAVLEQGLIVAIWLRPTEGY